MIRKLFFDFRGIRRACGTLTALRWLAFIVLTLPTVLRRRDLQSADIKMGPGPFVVRKGGVSVALAGDRVFSGVREMWVREVYSKDGFLQIADGATIVDLGANLGLFTVMALAANASARAIAVEPGRDHVRSLRANLERNAFSGRAQTCAAFVGDFTEVQTEAADTDPQYRDSPSLDEEEFLDRFGIDHIDFLKCDIEGSEYFLLEPKSRILDMTDRLAIELHPLGGDPRDFIATLERKGFRTHCALWSGDVAIVTACRPAAVKAGAI
jgi:FkbM family methyltransferase